jgi:hypothetical protein
VLKENYKRGSSANTDMLIDQDEKCADG